MKKILIISYFYPPSVFVGGQRIDYWAKNLHQFGYYPVIVTRNWNERQTTLTEEVIENELKIETYDTHEVHRLPIRRSLRDKLAEKRGMKIFQKTLTLWEIVVSNYSTKALPYGNMLSYSDELLQKGDFSALIVSGRPFQSFQFGYKLKKKHKILWIPDFRDEWNSHNRFPTRNPFLRFLNYLEKRSERKWVSNADFFLTVSDIFSERINKLNGIQGSVVKNGYDAIIPKPKREDDDLNILYAGTLYPYQDITNLTEAIFALDNPKIKFFFIGYCESPETLAYLKRLENEKPEIFQLIDKVPKEEFEKLICQMDIGIMTPYKNLTGCLPVKIFDYYAHGLELMLCPSDEDLMVDFIRDTQSGVTLNSQEECEAYLERQLKAKMEGSFDSPRNYDLGKEYHRLYQTEVLANTLDSFIKTS